MTLLEKLETIYNPPVPSLCSGHASSVAEFWNNVIKPNLPKKEIVLSWHKLLMDYVNKIENPCFAIRGYNSFPKGQYCDLRRGFFTKAGEFSFFYTDNYFAAYFQKMVLDGFVPTLEEFSSALKYRKFPSRFGQITTEEKELMALKQGKDPKINAAGFKLAHIIPVGKEYCFNNKVIGSKEILDTYFPKGKRNDWVMQFDNINKYYLRYLKVDSLAITYAKAHFLRFVHPFNYFLCPKQKCENNNVCKEIAEYQPLLDYAHDYMLSAYGGAYKDYLSLVMPQDRYAGSCFDSRLSSIEINYGLDIDCSTAQEPFAKEIYDLQKKLDMLRNEPMTVDEIKKQDKLQEQINSLKDAFEHKNQIKKSIQTKTDKDFYIKKFSAPQDTKSTELQMAFEYLSNPNTSFRKLEIKFLGIDSAERGGGFVAKEIINRLGITAEHKGILSRISLSHLIKRSTGNMLITLNEIDAFIKKQ